MITRRKICFVLGTASFATPVASFAQTRPPTVGFIDGLPAGSAASRVGVAAFEQGMREAGWVAGKTFILEYRSTNGRPEQYVSIAAEMVRLGPSVILTVGDALIREVAKATTSIPIVMASVGDPVIAGFTKSLARPDRNITGMSNLAVGLIGKWVELLAELTPRGSTYGVLRSATNTTHDRFWAEAEASAAATGNKLVSLFYRNQTELEAALAETARARPAALLVLPDPVTTSRNDAIAEFALKHRLPSIYLFREPVALGGLLSYGPSRADNFRRSAAYVDKILRGAKPAELPIEQVRQFELALNMKTAAALGIRPPNSLLLRVTELIE